MRYSASTKICMRGCYHPGFWEVATIQPFVSGTTTTKRARIRTLSHFYATSISFLNNDELLISGFRKMIDQITEIFRIHIQSTMSYQLSWKTEPKEILMVIMVRLLLHFCKIFPKVKHELFWWMWDAVTQSAKLRLRIWSLNRLLWVLRHLDWIQWVCVCCQQIFSNTTFSFPTMKAITLVQLS